MKTPTLTACVLSGMLAACSTQAPPPLPLTHPAHKEAAAAQSQRPESPSALRAYRDHSPPSPYARTMTQPDMGSSAAPAHRDGDHHADQ